MGENGDGRSRPEQGFVMVPGGSETDYLVLACRDRENELPVRVFVDYGVEWRRSGESESFCVWDLEVMAFERDAYVETVLDGSAGRAAAYLDRVAGAWEAADGADGDRRSGASR